MKTVFEQIIAKYSFSKPIGLMGTEIITREDKLVLKHRFHTEQDVLSYLQNREQINKEKNIALIIDPDEVTSILEIQ